MTSKINICNMALRAIGVDSIETLDTPYTRQSQRDCALYYPQAAETVLRLVPWTFAYKRRAPTSFTVPDVYEDIYDYAYVYPTDCAKLWRLCKPYSTKAEYYKIARVSTGEKIILTNIEEAYLEYTMTVTDPTWYDDDFVEAVAFRLAGYLAGPLRADPKRTQVAAAQYKVAVAQAERNNKLEEKPDDEEDIPWIQARSQD